MELYVIWSNEHKAWWGVDERGYCSSIDAAGLYSREHALKICKRARGGRAFNSNPSEVPLLLKDAEQFWPDEGRDECLRRERQEELDDYHRPDASGYSRADEEWFFDMDGKP